MSAATEYQIWVKWMFQILCIILVYLFSHTYCEETKFPSGCFSNVKVVNDHGSYDTYFLRFDSEKVNEGICKNNCLYKKNGEIFIRLFWIEGDWNRWAYQWGGRVLGLLYWWNKIHGLLSGQHLVRRMFWFTSFDGWWMGLWWCRDEDPKYRPVALNNSISRLYVIWHCT